MSHLWSHEPFSLRFEYLSVSTIAAIFVVLAAAVIILGLFSLGGESPIRRWMAIGMRLAVLALLVTIVGGAQFVRQNDDVEVVVLRDVSGSTRYVRQPPGRTLQSSLDDWFRTLADDSHKTPQDAIGIVSFDDRPLVDTMPTHRLRLDARPIRKPGNGTDAAAAINFGRAIFRHDTLHRLVLVWDGNATTGDLDGALDAASAAHVPIDVIPLHYRVSNAVTIEKFIAPAAKREREPFTLDVVLQNTASQAVHGTLTILCGGQPLDRRQVVLKPGANVQHVKTPPLEPGLQRFRANFEPDPAHEENDPSAAPDELRSAETFTFVRGHGHILYVDGEEKGAGETLLNALAAEGMTIRQADHITPENFPDSLAELQGYDAIILANVARGTEGLGEAQQKSLTAYVRDGGGGLVMIGGPRGFGAGGWIGSDLEKVLPVECSVPAIRALPPGGLLLVIDHSGSMGETIHGSSLSKQQIVNEAAVLALQTLTPRDYFGVIAFDSVPKWVVPLALNSNPTASAAAIRSITANGGTEIYPALVAACDALAPLSPDRAAVKHIILLTDGDSPRGDYPAVLQAMLDSRITLSTVGVGDDADRNLLAELASGGKGRFYSVDDPAVLPRIFIREASILRRPLIEESSDGIATFLEDPAGDMTQGFSSPQTVYGMVLTGRRQNPLVQMPLVAGPRHDPLLAAWQVGLGRCAAFTSDATARWAPKWVGSPQFGKFWAQVVRSVERPAMNENVELRTSVAGNNGHIEVESLDADGSFNNALPMECTILGPDLQSRHIHLAQTAPGTYSGDFEAREQGDYVTLVRYQDRHGKGGVAVGGLSVNTAREMRDLQSNEAQLREVAARTGGRVFTPFDPDVELFRKEGLWPAASIQPIWRLLLGCAMAALLLDVAVRRIAWDHQSIRLALAGGAAFVRSHTQTRQISPDATTIALRRSRQAAAQRAAPLVSAGRSDPQARFEGKALTGDIEGLLGGARVAVNDSAKRPTEPDQTLSQLRRVKQRTREQMDSRDKPPG